VDIEKRIAAVYRSCRTPEEIRAAFALLRSELEDQIQARLEHVDDEVRARLRVQPQSLETE
jgi:predicted Zn-ribbon and HTH transcriptional regulator